MTTAALFLHEFLAGVLFYTCFCRAIHMNDETTSYGVLFAFWILGLASVALIAAPIVSPWRPDFPTVLLMLAVIIVQVVTSRYWHAGVPQPFKVRHEKSS